MPQRLSLQCVMTVMLGCVITVSLGGALADVSIQSWGLVQFKILPGQMDRRKYVLVWGDAGNCGQDGLLFSSSLITLFQSSQPSVRPPRQLPRSSRTPEWTCVSMTRAFSMGEDTSFHGLIITSCWRGRGPSDSNLVSPPPTIERFSSSLTVGANEDPN